MALSLPLRRGSAARKDGQSFVRGDSQERDDQ